MKTKFKIGDSVQFIGSRELADSINKPAKGEKSGRKIYHPQLFKVTDIRTDTCYGGTQVHYNLRAIVLDDFSYKAVGVSVPKEFNGLFEAREIELEKAKV